MDLDEKINVLRTLLSYEEFFSEEIFKNQLPIFLINFS